MAEQETAPATGDEQVPPVAEVEAGGESRDDDQIDEALLAGAEKPDAVRNALQRQKDAAKRSRDEAQEAKRERDEALAKVKEFEDASKSDLERLTEENDGLKTELGQLRPQALRLKVAVEKGLVGDRAFLVDRLKGDSEEELASDADDLLKQFTGGTATTTSFDEGARATPPVQKKPEQAHNDLILGLTGHLPQQ